MPMSETSKFYPMGYIVYGNLVFTFYVYFISTFTLVVTCPNKLTRRNWQRVLYSKRKSTKYFVYKNKGQILRKNPASFSEIQRIKLSTYLCIKYLHIVIYIAIKIFFSCLITIHILNNNLRYISELVYQTISPEVQNNITHFFLTSADDAI